MPTNTWKTISLNEVAEEFVNGGTPSTKVPEYWSGDIPWITGADIRNFRVSEGRKRITKQAVEKSSTHLVPENTVLLVTRTSVGKAAITANPLCFSQDITGIKCKPIVRPEYLARYLTSIQDSLVSRVRGSTIKGLARADFAHIKVPVPPLEDQDRIAGIIERGERLRLRRQQANQLTNSIIQSVFLKMFGDPATNPMGWKTEYLGSILRERLAHGLSLVRAKVREEPSGLPVLKLSALTDNALDSSQIKYYDEQAEKIERWLLKKDDILVSRSNTFELVGRVGRYMGHPMQCIFPDLMIRVRPNSTIVEPAYLESHLRTAFVKSFFRQRARGTSGSMPKISNKDIEEVKVPIPPIELQKKLILAEERFHGLRDIQQISTQEINELFHSLMHKAFAGEIHELFKGCPQECS